MNIKRSRRAGFLYIWKIRFLYKETFLKNLANFKPRNFCSKLQNSVYPVIVDVVKLKFNDFIGSLKRFGYNLKKVFFLDSNQRRIQNLAKHLRWSFVRKRSIFDVWPCSECVSPREKLTLRALNAEVSIFEEKGKKMERGVK